MAEVSRDGKARRRVYVRAPSRSAKVNQALHC
jgi:hypothetical protein